MIILVEGHYVDTNKIISISPLEEYYSHVKFTITTINKGEMVVQLMGEEKTHKATHEYDEDETYHVVTDSIISQAENLRKRIVEVWNEYGVTIPQFNFEKNECTT